MSKVGKIITISCVFVGLVLCGGLFAAVLNQVPTIENLPDDEPVATSVGPVKAAPKKAASGDVADGIWEVGAADGIKAGTYRVTGPLDASSMCYWQVSTDGAGANILKNGVETGGTPQVIVKDGQWFKTTGCGTWKRR